MDIIQPALTQSLERLANAAHSASENRCTRNREKFERLQNLGQRVESATDLLEINGRILRSDCGPELPEELLDQVLLP